MTFARNRRTASTPPWIVDLHRQARATWFLDRIATHILACEGDSKWVFFDGNYQEYEADKKKRLGEEAARPHRMRYKALK
jgi:hypothetical protein